jgi:hypothetical protein
MNELDKARLIDEDTVLPAVPLWWRVLDAERAQAEIDRLGSGAMMTDWGSRIISRESELYDPLSYHNGSVWPLFTGWAAMGAYRYGRPQVGFYALTSNALLTFTGALGYVTELLSGDFNAPFGRSSHHQVWSEAMVVTPLVRGLLGIEAGKGGRELTFAPQLPINWSGVKVRNVAAGQSRYDISLERGAGRMTITVERREGGASSKEGGPGAQAIFIAPALPLDAKVRRATVNGRVVKFEAAPLGDIQRAQVRVEQAPSKAQIVLEFSEGTDVYFEREQLIAGQVNKGLRILRSRADDEALRLTLEGLAGSSYLLNVQTPFRIDDAEGYTVVREAGRDQQLYVSFEGTPGSYARKELSVPLNKKR